MRIFVTGASGWIGSAVVPELLEAGHEVVGLARSEEAIATLTAAGAKAQRGSLDDLESLRAGAEASDGVIHLAYKHDFSDMAGAGRTERAAIEMLGNTLAGSDRPLLFASGVLIAPGRVVTEEDAAPMSGPDSPRGGSEQLALGYAERGVRSVSLRFAPTVHGDGDHGFHLYDRRRGAREGNLRLRGRGLQSLARGASTRCRPHDCAGTREGAGRLRRTWRR
jgi:nucleoside-diphosphate-sugar epimerase